MEKEIERLTSRIEDLFILIAAQGGMPSEKIRESLGIGKERINKISKNVKNYGRKKEN